MPWIFSCCLALALTIRSVLALGEQYAFETVLPQPRLCIQDGCLLGQTLAGLEAGPYDAFLGIPFAKPPVGELRFRNPVPNDPWSGDYDATWERSRCIQKDDTRPQQTVQGGEDCLYLNVYRPKNIKTPLPVMVYMHGGGYYSGSAAMGEFGPERLMDTKKVILVVLQYRLGMFGFLSTGDKESPGNYGLKDQVLALKWVQRNIAFFGGDPKLVTLMGQSATGSAVQWHLMSPLSKGLFSRAVSMSGSALAFWNYIEDPLGVARRHATAAGIPKADKMSTKNLVESLRSIDAIDLVKSMDRLKVYYVHPTILYGPSVEQFVDSETFMSEDPRDLWASGKYHQIPYTVGFVPNEGAFATANIVSNSSLLNELNERSATLIPQFMALNNTLGAQMLKDKFFPDGTSDRWLTNENLKNFQDMVSEGYISYPIVLTIKQYLAFKSQSPKAPLSVYYFNFRGPYSRSYYFSYTYGNFGVCHSDDLSYLFRPAALFPDLPQGTPAWYMSKVLIDYYVQFAYEGISGPLCTNESCQVLEFTNSNDPREPVETNLLEGFNEDRFAFWYNLSALQSYSV